MLNRVLPMLMAVVVACVVVPPPQNAQTPQPPTPGQPAETHAGQYGGATYGVNACSNSYGGVTYGGPTCGSWISEGVMPALFPAIGPGLVGVAVMQQSGSEPCRVQMSFRGCQPAVGANVTLTDLATGAPLSAQAEGQGYVYIRIPPGRYKVRVDYLGTALERAVTFDAATLAQGATIGVSLSPNDRR